MKAIRQAFKTDLAYLYESRGGRAWPNATGLGPVLLAGARVQISPPANSICDVKAGFGNSKWKSQRKEDFNKFSDNLKQVSMSISWHQLQQLQSALHKTQTRRFAGKRKTPKYGSLSKAFSDIQLQRFLHVIDSGRFRLLFRYQAQLGLRILCCFWCEIWLEYRRETARKCSQTLIGFVSSNLSLCSI